MLEAVCPQSDLAVALWDAELCSGWQRLAFHGLVAHQLTCVLCHAVLCCAVLCCAVEDQP
jgi:hypothetical protein